MLLVQKLFYINPSKFIEVAKDKSYNEFKDYFKSQSNFKVCEMFTEEDWQQLYCLSRA